MVKHGETRKTVGYQKAPIPLQPPVEWPCSPKFLGVSIPIAAYPCDLIPLGIQIILDDLRPMDFSGLVECASKRRQFLAPYYIGDTPRGGASHPVFLLGRQGRS